MPISALRQRISSAALDFAWEEWAQMGVLAAASRRSPWAQDPEALVLLTLELARDDPRLFDELLDWLVRNERIVSGRRLQTLCEGPDDARLVRAALDWVARRRGRRPAPQRAHAHADGEPLTLFRGLSTPVRNADPAFLSHGLLRQQVAPSGKSREPDLARPINLAFRLRRLLGVSARAEVARLLLTTDATPATAASVASSAGYAKRNVQEALTSLHAAGAAALVTIGSEQRYAADRSRWVHLLGIDAEDLPSHRDWPALFSALRTILRGLDRPELAHASDYLRASQARDLLDEARPRLARAGVACAARRGAETAWDDLVDVVDGALQALTPQGAVAGSPAHFEVYVDAAEQHRWRLIAGNGRIMAISPQSYASRATALAATDRLRRRADSLSYTVDTDRAGNHGWRATAANGQSVAISAESFASRPKADRAARTARELAAVAHDAVACELGASDSRSAATA